MQMSVRKIKSAFNGELEITYSRGRKILDGATVNLSYGSVHRIWKSGLRKVNLDGVKRVLLLGLGGGSVIDILRNQYEFAGHITAIELDPVMIRVAKSEFGIGNSSNQKIKMDNAFDFIHRTRQRFDLIITDVFIESKVAPEVFEPTYWDDIMRILSEEGCLLMNVSTSGGSIRRCRQLMKNYDDTFRFELINKAGGSNTLLKAVLSK
jgi:predicted O-methyltransferase YrrM